ncbi:MAG TPA: hypothetical protein VMP01_08985 [Pirellulaceae bacterium]|nr:hypothetical protein [Pirellulaceae bacterium]
MNGISKIKGLGRSEHKPSATHPWRASARKAAKEKQQTASPVDDADGVELLLAKLESQQRQHSERQRLAKVKRKVPAKPAVKLKPAAISAPVPVATSVDEPGIVVPLSAGSPLSDLIESYFTVPHKPHGKPPGDRWRGTMDSACELLRSMLHRRPTIGDLQPATFDRFLAAVRRQYGADHAEKIERATLALWRFACKCDLATGAPFERLLLLNHDARPTAEVRRILASVAGQFVAGMTFKKIAASIGVHEVTLVKWRKRHRDLWDEILLTAMKPVLKEVDGWTPDDKMRPEAQVKAARAAAYRVVVAKPGDGTLAGLLESYILARDLAGETVQWYRRVIGMFGRWYGGTVPMDAFDVELANRFLATKQRDLAAAASRRSWRATLRALLNYADKPGKLRPVKWEPLNPQSWTAAQVGRLIDAAPDQEWRNVIALAYYSGLNLCDLESVTKANIDRDGVLTWRRSKTGKLVKIRLPESLVAVLPSKGPCCPRRFSKEYFRRVFRRIAAAAGLEGPFKQLRKSSGTLVESLHPGCGHLHLGNTRQVFELHYLHPEKGLTPLSPPMLPTIGATH